MFHLVYKPRGISSFDVLRILRKHWNIKKMGHTGTLDPLAEGLLLVASENSTKLISHLEKAQKTYEFSARLDGISETGDLEGPIQEINTQGKEISQSEIQKILEQNFHGKIFQTPPKYSALKIDGVPAYKKARKGESVDIPTREVAIHEIEILSYDFPEITIRTTVSAGTYIRSLASDIGESLGLGGYLTELKRTGIDHLDLSYMNNAEKIDDPRNPDAPLQIQELSYEEVFSHISVLDLDTEAKDKLQTGIKIELPNVSDGKYFINHKESLGLIEVVDNHVTKIKNDV